MPPASPERLGLQCKDRAWSLLQADTRERLEVVSQEEVAARLLRWLEAELRRTNRSGCTSSSCTGRPCSCSSPVGGGEGEAGAECLLLGGVGGRGPGSLWQGGQGHADQ